MRAISLLALIYKVANAQVPAECFNQSFNSYGLQTGTPYSSMELLQNIQFDRTMVLNSVTGCFGAESELFSIQIITKSTKNDQEFKMPLTGEVIGQCRTIKLNDGDSGMYFTIYYTSKTVVGFTIETTQGTTLTLGSTTTKGASKYKYTIESDSLLVGFYGTKTDAYINSIGIIYLEPSCLPEIELPVDPNNKIAGKSSAAAAVEHVAIGLLAVALIIACGVIVKMCEAKRRFQSIGLVKPNENARASVGVLPEEDSESGPQRNSSVKNRYNEELEMEDRSQVCLMVESQVPEEQPAMEPEEGTEKNSGKVLIIEEGNQL